ncbi:hypothetical protein ACV343_32730, partial [Pseudomonas aeruginosa]
ELELAEIATLTQSPLETVKSRFRYAVQKLRRLLRRVGAEMSQHLLFGDARGMLLGVHTATSSASSRR